MDTREFRVHAHRLVDWMSDYLEQVREYPVRARVSPGEILAQLPDAPPEKGESFEALLHDFEEIILPGMTHWQHPSFFGYFPANSSPPSILAEMLTATLGAQCMSWQTSPAATELEQQVMRWLGKMIGLPERFSGVIQDTASTATLCSILTAREAKSGFGINDRGFTGEERYVVYASEETHSSIEKGVKIAGIGRENIRKIEVDDTYAMQVRKLEESVRKDLDSGLTPLCVVATLGTTGSTAIDPLRNIGEVCRQYSLWLHVDAAFAGTALVLPEYRWMLEGIEQADTFVFNPHKWMFTNFDCSAYFVKDSEALLKTFEILPEYLKTAEGKSVNNYRDWGIQLGRRFRALKLWFVIRTYGVDGIQQRLREQMTLARWLVQQVESTADFELMAPLSLNLVCFRYHPAEVDSVPLLNQLNERLLEVINKSGSMYITHTKLRGNLVLRLQTGQTSVEKRDVEAAWETIVAAGERLSTD